jgi:superfamily II DNA/RNA helicase
MNFNELKVNEDIVRALKEQGITEATNIQEKSIPIIMEGKDLVGISKTGSGKTASFGVPTLEKVIPGKGIQLLVIAPTRELAVQIADELKKFSKYSKKFITTIYGGVALGPQADALQRTDIVVGTPGRLLDHLNRRNLDLSKISCVVLDEADKMVEMGFIEDISQILDATPRERQTILFGATISNEIDDMKNRYMHDPVVVEAEAQVAEDFLEQYYYNIQQREKFSLLVHLLKKEKMERAIIFCSARSTVELVTRNLKLQGIKADMIHGKLSQNKRLHTIEGFHKGKVDILVASAVAARGLDIKDVTHIFNYDLSQDPQEYIHRVGRTARAGEKGKAITLLCDRDFGVFGQILDKYRVHVEEVVGEKFPALRFDTSRREQRGFQRRSFGNSDGRSGHHYSGRDGMRGDGHRPNHGGRSSSGDSRPASNSMRNRSRSLTRD